MRVAGLMPRKTLLLLILQDRFLDCSNVNSFPSVKNAVSFSNIVTGWLLSGYLFAHKSLFTDTVEVKSEQYH